MITSLSSPALGYRKFVTETARRLSKFAPLDVFLQQRSSFPASITGITFSDRELPAVSAQIETSALESHLKLSKNCQILIVENLTPEVAALIGGYWNVDPQCFLDYLDQRKAGQIVPINWYRIDGIEDHLPILRSVRREMDHIHFRFIGAREYHPNDPSEPPLELPLNLDQKEALTRHCATAWFNGRDSPSGWTKGVLLLDPAFEAKGLSTHSKDVKYYRKNSTYRSFTTRPSRPTSTEENNVDRRDSYRLSLIYSLKRNLHLQVPGIPCPLLILQDLYRIIASEWIAVNTYIERDLNTIEWRIEREIRAPLEVFESFQLKLFRLRRRTTKYEALVSDQIQSLEAQRDLFSTSTSVTRESRPSQQELISALVEDFAQVLDLVRRNSARITHQTSLITSLMSVRAGKAQAAQSQRVGVLTVVATLVLPFNAIAAILAIEGDFGPLGNRFWVLWAAAGGMCVLILGSISIHYVVSSRRKSRIT
ncbi:hypothetical protein K469DRAFT_753417 [Zopfia rhizophila CBS 207.26]|uniref:Cora-domain-containing protein n=1 Tax=Zopfia rhizophila CBS 207.26 TaxID=1314779 RepID=A0A6A6DLN4_9PEZI|nr:hypothetical protein K469DRAFT_753417 [Zopfia rhizophila CBS 207.26]